MLRDLLRLVTVDEEGHPTRWRLPGSELSDQVWAEWAPFVTRRLLTTDTDDGADVVEVAHEAFLSAWPPLATLIADNATALRARRRIEQAAAEWVRQQRPRRRLWTGDQLAAARADTGARFDKSVSEERRRDLAGAGKSKRRWRSSEPHHRQCGVDRNGPRVSACQHPPGPIPALARHRRSFRTARARAHRHRNRRLPTRCRQATTATCDRPISAQPSPRDDLHQPTHCTPVRRGRPPSGPHTRSRRRRSSNSWATPDTPAL